MELELYVSAIIITLTVYFLVVLRISKQEGIALSDVFKDMFKRKQSATSIEQETEVPTTIKEQIKRLEKEMYESDDGERRQELLEQIRELEANT